MILLRVKYGIDTDQSIFIDWLNKIRLRHCLRKMESGLTPREGALQYFHVGENGHLSEDQAFLILQGNNVLTLDIRWVRTNVLAKNFYIGFKDSWKTNQMRESWSTLDCFKVKRKLFNFLCWVHQAHLLPGKDTFFIFRNLVWYFEDFCIIFNHHNKMSMELVTNLDNYFKGDRNICLHKEVSRTSFETGLSLKAKILDEALDRLNISFKRIQPKLKIQAL